MQVILKEDVPSLGKAGEVVKVQPGYARNFLIPLKKAMVADKGSLASLEHHKKAIAHGEAKKKLSAELVAKNLGDHPISIQRDAGEGGKLFGSVTTKDVAEALRKEKIIVDRRNILLPEPIRELGNYTVEIKLHSEVRGSLQVNVVKP